MGLFQASQIASLARLPDFQPFGYSRVETTGVHVFSWTYAESNGVFGAHSALSFPNFFPKFYSRFCLLAVDEQAMGALIDI